MVGSKTHLGGFVKVSPFDFIDKRNNQVIGTIVIAIAIKLTIYAVIKCLYL